MSGSADWLPPLVLLADLDGDWDKYVNAVFSVFYRDFIQTQPRFQGKWVRCRRDPIYDGKEAGFWHCVSEGADEAERTPDIRRCERIAWIRAVIEHADGPGVDVWTSRKRREPRVHIWLKDEYLVVLGARTRYYQLVTAHCTNRPHTRERLRGERNESRNG